MYLASSIFRLGLSQLLVDLCNMGMVVANAVAAGYAFKEFLYLICSHSIFILSFPVSGYWWYIAFLTFLFLTESQSASEHEWWRGRERGRQNLKQAPGSELSAETPMWGSNSQIRPQDHDLSQSQTLNWLSHPGAPRLEAIVTTVPSGEGMLMIGEIMQIQN